MSENLHLSDTQAVFLIGFMGSGKTTWGRKLANKTGGTFIDLDEHISEEIGQSIPEYFKRHGEESFRALESQTLKSLTFTELTIVSTGGGTPCFFDNMSWMNGHGITIYFQLPPKALWDRLTKSNIASRPALQGLTGEALLEHITNKLAERKPYYEKAKHIVNQLTLTMDELLEIVQQRSGNSYGQALS